MRAALPFAVALSVLAAAAGAHAANLRVGVNHSLRLPLSGPASSVVLGSDGVVDVSVIDSRTVFISGKTPGSTDVTVIDPLGRTVFHGDISVALPPGSSVAVYRGSVMTQSLCNPSCSASGGAAPAVAGGGGGLLNSISRMSAMPAAPPVTPQ